MSLKGFFITLGVLLVATLISYQLRLFPAFNALFEEEDPRANSPYADLLSLDETYYLTFDPPFIVNFSYEDSLRYLQIALSLAFPDEQLVAEAERHMPAIRNAIILVLSNQQFEDLFTITGKEDLRRQLKNAVNAVIFPGANGTTDPAGEIFITNFILQ